MRGNPDFQPAYPPFQSKFGVSGSGHVSDEHGHVVPPPPMFEEGNLNMKTPLITKKCGKTEKKDKMESRV